MKKVVWATSAILYFAAASAAFAAEEAGAPVTGVAAGAQADTISDGDTSAVGVGAVGALAGIALALSGGGDGSNTGTTTVTNTNR